MNRLLLFILTFAIYNIVSSQSLGVEIFRYQLANQTSFIDVAVEMTEYYFKVKSIFIAYSNIPQIIKEKVMSILKWEKKEEEKKES